MKKFSALLLALVLMLAAAGCAGKPEAGLADFLGNPVELAAYPQRIVSLSPANTEIVYALGLGDRLVGVDNFSDYPEAACALPKVGDFYNPNAEVIIALKPDLVLGGNKLQKDAIEKVRALGVNVVAAEATAYEDIYTSIELVGKLTGAQKKAAEVIADMRAKEKIVRDAVAKSPRGKTVYYAMSFGEAGNWTGGPGSFPYELIEMSGGRNVSEGMYGPWLNMSQEELVSRDPDIVLLDASMGSDPAQFGAAEGYRELKAVKNGNVYIVTSDYCTLPGPRIVYGLREYAQFITGQTIQFPGE